MKGNHEFDLIVVGLGSMGSACTYYAAKNGLQVLGLDQYSVPHLHGSHSGESRIVRMAYFEHPNYVPLLKKAYENWTHLEKASNQKLFNKSGLLYFGHAKDVLLKGVRKSSSLYKIKTESFSTSQLQNQFPAFSNSLSADFENIFEPDAGYVVTSQTIKTYKNLALEKGAQILENTKVHNWFLEEGLVKVECGGQKFRAKKIIFTAGAWVSSLIPKLTQHLKVSQQSYFYFNTSKEASFQDGNFPCWNVQFENEEDLIYGFPISAQGLKIAYHKKGIDGNIENVERTIPQKEIQEISSIARTIFPNAGLQLKESGTCLYTNTKDGHFRIDFMSNANKKVILATGFSGHGFKFVPAIGELLVDMVMEERKPGMIDFLRIRN